MSWITIGVRGRVSALQAHLMREVAIWPRQEKVFVMAVEIMTPLERVASTPKGQPESPDPDFANIADEGHRNGCRLQWVPRRWLTNPIWIYGDKYGSLRLHLYRHLRRSRHRQYRNQLNHHPVAPSTPREETAVQRPTSPLANCRCSS
jgi:hypothetical protein